MSLFSNLKSYEPENGGAADFEDMIYVLQDNGAVKAIDVPDDTEVE